MGTLHMWDWVVVGGYFAVLIGLCWWVILKSKDTADDYFLAGRNLGWFVVGASIFASNIGSEHLVGLAGSGCTDGVAMAHYELHAWCLLILGWVLIPFYARSMVYTMPEFLEKRFSPGARYLLSVISLVAYVLTKVAVGIFAGGVVFATLLPDMKIESLGLNAFWIGSILVVVGTGIYTVLGGLRAVSYTSALQSMILVFGSVLVTYYGLKELGGWSGLQDTLPSDMFNLWKPMGTGGGEVTWAPEIIRDETGKMTGGAWYFNQNYPWVGMLFCAPIIGLWYWCTDQYIVQRALGAANEREARRGSIFAAFLKLLPVFMFIIPGMICFALAIKGTPGLETLVDDNKQAVAVECQAAFPLMVKHVLPIGVKGIVVAGLLSALMSSLAGVFNASSTLFTMDLYQKFKPNASQKQLVWIGRMATVFMVVVGLAWIPVIQGARGLYDYLQSVQGYLAPPIFVVFFLGVFMKRLNGKGCMASLIVGFLLGLFRLGVDTVPKVVSDFAYTEGSFLWIVNNMFFQYYSLIIFLVCSAVMIVVSYMTEKPSEEQINGLTYGAVSDEDKKKTRESWNWVDVVTSVIVMGAIIAAYVYFSGT